MNSPSQWWGAQSRVNIRSGLWMAQCVRAKLGSCEVKAQDPPGCLLLLSWASAATKLTTTTTVLCSANAWLNAALQAWAQTGNKTNNNKKKPQDGNLNQKISHNLIIKIKCYTQDTRSLWELWKERVFLRLEWAIHVKQGSTNKQLVRWVN